MDVKKIQVGTYLIDPINACIYKIRPTSSEKFFINIINVYKLDLLHGLEHYTTITSDTCSQCHEINYDVYWDLVRISERFKSYVSNVKGAKLQEEDIKQDDLNFELPESKPNQFFY